MDIETFIDELEKVCDCPNQGYIKCLEKVKELTAEIKKLKSNNIKGEITCDCQLGNPCEGGHQIAPNGELCCSYAGDPQTKIIWDQKIANKKLKEIEAENVKLKNDLQIAKMLYIDDYVREEIHLSIDEGIRDFTINCGYGFFREHKLKFIDEHVIPELTTHTDGDKPYSCFKNGFFYYRKDCMYPHTLEYNKDGTMRRMPIKNVSFYQRNIIYFFYSHYVSKSKKQNLKF
mgnify:CR=1 FL=1